MGNPVEYASAYTDWDLFGALGTFNIQVVRVSLSLFKTQHEWTASGRADFEYHDKYDFDQHDNVFNQSIRDGATMLFAWDWDFDIAALDALAKAGLAKKFDVSGSWTEIDFPVFPPHGTWTGAP